MEPLGPVFDGVKRFFKSGEELVRGVFRGRYGSNRNKPIEILKRLQREAFSDLMKLRDRQESVEQMLYLLTSGKGKIFQETSTNMKGIINVCGAILFQDCQEAYNALYSSGISNGVNARFLVRTNLRQKDALLAELAAHNNNMDYGNEFTGSPLVLSKVMYLASISDLLSAASIPLGATCNDFQLDSDHLQIWQGNCLTGLSLSRPPLFNLPHACGIGLSLKAPKFSASFAELVSGWSAQKAPASHTNNLSTFGQISSQPFGETKLTLSGAWQIPCSFSSIRLRSRARSKPAKREPTSPDTGEPTSSTSERQSAVCHGGAICMSLDIDESAAFGCWVEVKKSSPALLNWGISLSDLPKNEIGWGLIVGGSSKEESSSVVLESFLNFSVGKSAILQPGLVFKSNEGNRAPGLVFRSIWSM